jgi:hypothetical protein
VTFRFFLDSDPPTPTAGELQLRPADRLDAHRTDIATLALEKGCAGFVQGPGPITQLIAPHDPTLDEMLAVLFLMEALAGRPLPRDCAFASYTASLRKGIRPSEAIPLEDSLEGIYLAIRNAVGDPLTEPDRAARFLSQWERLAAMLLQAIHQRIDPYNHSFFTEATVFQDERQFLRHDLEVYRRDVERGRRWLVHLPDETAPVAGLWLNDPRSALFKFLARLDSAAPQGTGYRFLAVSRPGQLWTFSTDPVDHRRIDSLQQELQKVEQQRDPQRAAQDPWFEGSRFKFTLIGSPKKGTLLNNEEVLSIVQRWGKVREVSRSRMGRRTLVGAVAALLVLLVALTAIWGAGKGRSTPSSSAELAERSSQVSATSSPGSEVIQQPRGSATSTGIEAVRQAVDFKEVVDESRERQVRSRRVTFPLEETPEFSKEGCVEEFDLEKPGRVKFWLQFRSSEPLPFKTVAVEVPGATPVICAIQSGDSDTFWTKPIAAELPTGKTTVRVRFGEPCPGKRVAVEAVWQPNNHGVLHIYTLAVGVGEFRPNPRKLVQLPFAPADADDFTSAMKAANGPPFDVQCMPSLTNQRAKRMDIVKGLTELQQRVEEERSSCPVQLVVVLFSGHGMIIRGDSFVYAPHDYDPTNGNYINMGDLRMTLLKMPCPVLLILDTCHSGQAATELAAALTDGRVARGEDDVNDAIKSFSAQKPGLFVLASSLPSDESFETKDWKHGALTLAVLEKLGGRNLVEMPAPDGHSPAWAGDILTLADLQDYATFRVKQLTKAIGNPQTVVPMTSGSINPSLVPLAVKPAVAK